MVPRTTVSNSLNVNAQANDRVVSTTNLFMGGMCYTNIIADLPGYIVATEEVRSVSDKIQKKYANSRDAAHSGNSLARFFQREESFFDRGIVPVQAFAITARESQIFRRAFGYGYRSDDKRVWRTAANPIVRAAFGISLHKEIQKWARKHAEQDCYCLTIIHEPWQTSRTGSMININEMTASVKTALEAIGYEGMMFIEIQGMRGQKKDLHPHVHGIIRPKKKSVGVEGAMQRLSTLFPDFDGIRGVDMQLCKERCDIEHFTMYSAKSPDTVKRLYTDGSERGMKTREGTSGYTARFASHLLQIRSLISLSAVVITQGNDFIKLKERILKRTSRKLESWGYEHELCNFPLLAKAWQKVHVRNPVQKPRPKIKYSVFTV